MNENYEFILYFILPANAIRVFPQQNNMIRIVEYAIIHYEYVIT